MLTNPLMTQQLKRCQTITAALVLAGFGSAVAIYLTAVRAPDDPFAEFEKSKKFTSELARMGGKSAVVAHDLNKWFSGLWQGESLAYSVIVITIVVAAIYYFISTSMVYEQHDSSKE
jgi:hypothetical protein